MQINGTVGNDCEVKIVEIKSSGKKMKVVNYSVAEPQFDSQTSLWVNCSRWYPENVDINKMQLPNKGDIVSVFGFQTIVVSDGRAKLNLNVTAMHMLRRKSSQNQTNQEPPPTFNKPSYEEDDLPF